MEAIMIQLTPWFQWLTRSTLQVSILVCIILLVKTVLRTKLAPRWHYCLWLLVIARMLMPAAPQSSFSVFNLIPDTIEHASPAPVTEIAQVVEIDETPIVIADPPLQTETTQPIPQAVALQDTTSFAFPQLVNILPILWLIGAIALAIYVFAGNFRLWSIVKLKRPVTDSRVLDLLEDCKAQMNIHVPLAVVETDRVTSPALFGFLRPRLLLPEGMLNALTGSQLRHILLHELAHLKRGDIYLGWLVAILQIIHWFNPIVWLGFNRMRSDRELACDNLALSAMPIEEPAEYGRTIVKLLENFSKPKYTPSLAGILEERSQLKKRITMIAKFKKGSYKFSAMAAVLFIVLGVVALTNAKGTSANIEEKTALAESFTELLIAEKFEQAAQNFDNKMKTALPAARLAEVWKATTAQAGPFEKQLGTRAEKILWTDIIYVTCQFKEGPIDIKVVYNRNSKVSGLWFVPVPQNVLQEYADQIESSGSIGIDTITDFLPGDSIEITQIFGTSNRIEPGQTYTIKVKYKLSSRDKAQIHFLSTNGSTGCSQGPIIKRGRGEFTRTLNYIEGNKDAWLQSKFVPVGGNESFGNLYFNNKNSNVSDITRIKGVTSIINRQTDPQGGKPSIPIEIDTTMDFLPGDSIEITQILGSTGKIEPGQTYTIKGKYKLASQDKAILHLYATNGETTCDQGPVINKGRGKFTRTFSYQEKGWLHLGLYSHPGNEGNFGNIYFNHKNGYVPDITKIEGMTSGVGVQTGEDIEETYSQIRKNLQEAANVLGTLNGMLQTANSTIHKGEIKAALAIMEIALPRFEKIVGMLKETGAAESSDMVLVLFKETVSAMKAEDLKKAQGLMESAYGASADLHRVIIGEMNRSVQTMRNAMMQQASAVARAATARRKSGTSTTKPPTSAAARAAAARKIAASRHTSTTKRPASAAARAAASRRPAKPKVTKTVVDGNVATLKNGTRVELLGVLKLLDKGIESWLPDGRPAKIKGIAESDIDVDGIVVAFRVLGEQVSYRATTMEKSKVERLDTWYLNGRGIWLVEFSADKRYEDLYLRDIESGPWTKLMEMPVTADELRKNEWITKFKDKGFGKIGQFKLLTPQSFKVNFFLDHERVEGDILAIDQAGRMYDNTAGGYWASKRELTYNLSPKDLAGFCLGQQDTGSVHFKNISLVPGQLSKVTVLKTFVTVKEKYGIKSNSLPIHPDGQTEAKKTNPKTTIETPNAMLSASSRAAAARAAAIKRAKAKMPTTARATKTAPSPQQAAKNAMFLMEVLEKTFDSVKDSVDQGNTEAAMVILETQKPHIDILVTKLGGFALADQLTLFTNQFMDVEDLLKQNNIEKAKAILKALAITINELEDMVREATEKAKK